MFPAIFFYYYTVHFFLYSLYFCVVWREEGKGGGEGFLYLFSSPFGNLTLWKGGFVQQQNGGLVTKALDELKRLNR